MIKFRTTIPTEGFQYLSQFSLIVFCILIAFFCIPVSESGSADSSLFNEFFQSALRPEQGEALGFFLLISGSCGLFTILGVLKKNVLLSIPKIFVPMLCLLLAWMMFYVSRFEVMSALLPANLPSYLVGILLCLSLVWSSRDRNIFHLVLRILILGFLFLLVYKFRIHHFNDVDDSGQWSNHFQTFFNPIGLFSLDRFDFDLYQPQYGLSGFYLKWLLTPGTDPVFRVTLGCAIIYVLSLVILFERTRIFLSHQITRTLLIATLVFLTGHHFLAIHEGTLDPYLQYFPLRFSGPVLGFLMVSILQLDFDARIKVFILSALSAFIFTWNLDSGLPVLLSFAVLILIYRSYRSGLSYILLTSIFIVILFSFIGISLPQFMQLFKFQRIWVEMGFGMLPAPREPHLWHFVAGIYIFTLILNLGPGRFNDRAYLVSIFLALTGLQLFAYYGGKSDDISFIDVSWPAVILCFLYLDRFMELNPHRWEKFLVFLLPSLFGGQLLFATPQLMTIKKDKVQDKLSFLKNSDEQCEIVSGHAGLYRHYFPELSSWNGPSLSELPLKADYENYLSFLRTKKCLYIEPRSLNSNFRGGKAILYNLRKEMIVPEGSLMGETSWIKGTWK